MPTGSIADREYLGRRIASPTSFDRRKPPPAACSLVLRVIGSATESLPSYKIVAGHSRALAIAFANRTHRPDRALLELRYSDSDSYDGTVLARWLLELFVPYTELWCDLTCDAFEDACPLTARSRAWNATRGDSGVPLKSAYVT